VLAQSVQAVVGDGHDLGADQLVQAVTQHAGRHAVAAVLQSPEAQRIAPELPQDPQRPPPTEQVEHHQQRPAGGRSPGWLSGTGRYEPEVAKLSIDLRTRELIIDRVCARCGCEYEWEVHVAFFAQAAGLNRYGIEATKADNPTDPVLRLVDELHDTAHVSDELWAELSDRFTDEQLLDMVMLSGWYHAICFAANAGRLPLERIRTEA